MAKIKNPTLIIGLGGTGFHCISKVKNLTKKEFNEIPNSVKFLAIDFDNAEANKSAYEKIYKDETSDLKASSNSSAEWVRISSGRDVDYESFTRNTDLSFFENDKIQKTSLIDTIGGFDLKDGAGQKRILGKIGLSYSTNYDKIKRKIRDTIRPLETVNIDGNENWDTIDILLVNSFSGGAGAGMFLDIILMLNNLDGVTKNIDVYTFNFLPDVFLDGISKEINKDLVIPNTYGAFTELEYIYNNVENFIPTNQDEVLGSKQKLPKANFVINQNAYNGSKVSLKTMIYSTSKVMFNSILAGEGMDSAWSNFQQTMISSVKNKDRRFCSLGYAEIVFDIEKLKKYTISKILNKALRGYDANIIDSNTASSNLSIFTNYRDNYIENLLTIENNTSFRDTLKNINFTQPSLSKKAFKRLKNTIQQNKTNFKSDIEKAINEFYNHSKIIDAVKNEKDFITQRTIKKTIIDKKINDLKTSLNSFKIDLDEDKEFQKKKIDFKKKYEIAFDDINRLGRQNKNWFGRTKSSFFKTTLPNRVIKLKKIIENEYSDIILKEEIARLFNNDIDNGIEILSIDYQNNNVDKLDWINSNKTEFTLNQNYDNIIYLEYYFQRHIIDKIENDSEINASLIEDLLAGKNDFITTIQHTDTMQYITELQSKNLYELKELLTSDEVNQIVSKISELINPLWDRVNDNDLKKANIDRLSVVERLVIPANKNNEKGDYFGSDTFEIMEGDISTSSDIHKQSFLKLELGLPAFLIKSLKKYKNTFDELIEVNPNLSVLYFTYNDIRKKVLNGETGVFVFNDDNELELQDRAMHAWAFGWATGIFFKQNNRIKVKISQNFQSNSTNESKIENGVYDVFKDFGQSADLIRIFNTLKDDAELLSDIEFQLSEIKKVSNKDFLIQIAKSFKPTSKNDKKQKFRTEKKAYSQLNIDEKRLLNSREQEALRLGCEEIANSNSIKIDFYDDKDGNDSYLRLDIK